MAGRWQIMHRNQDGWTVLLACAVLLPMSLPWLLPAPSPCSGSVLPAAGSCCWLLLPALLLLCR